MIEVEMNEERCILTYDEAAEAREFNKALNRIHDAYVRCYTECYDYKLFKEAEEEVQKVLERFALDLPIWPLVAWSFDPIRIALETMQEGPEDLY